MMSIPRELAGKLDQLPEPMLEFRYGQRALDPRDGLALFGPFGADQPSHPKSLRYGLVGSPRGIERFREFAALITGPIFSTSDPRKSRLWPAFPGFEAAYHCTWPAQATREFGVDAGELELASRNADPNKRAYEVVNRYLEGAKAFHNAEEIIDVIICVVPDIVYRNCRPESVVSDAVGRPATFAERGLRARYVRNLFELDADTEAYRLSVDFRRQLKARSMQYEMPIQIVRESTLRSDDTPPTFGERQLSPLSDRAWNLSLAVFYKAGGHPWRLSTAREGVCYVGLVFRRADPLLRIGTACCAAQMFLDDGDGIVLRGDFGPWFSQETKQFHLTRPAARSLLSRVLETYSKTHGKPLKEVFLHYRISLEDEEYGGFLDAIPSGVKLVAIRIREERGTRLYREGSWPVRRGTFWKVASNWGFLWASGFKPRLGTYDGTETPVPTRIAIEHGKAEIEQVATDVLGLTKLNYNECKFGDARPVTIGFSGAVGEILVSNPTVKNPNPRFKFYI